jgi:organic hydroperoxide reductase OsmC/OhrA
MGSTAETHTTKNEVGKVAVASVTLHPNVIFSGRKQMPDADFQSMHHEAHEKSIFSNHKLRRL